AVEVRGRSLRATDRARLVARHLLRLRASTDRDEAREGHEKNGRKDRETHGRAERSAFKGRSQLLESHLHPSALGRAPFRPSEFARPFRSIAVVVVSSRELVGSPVREACDSLRRAAKGERALSISRAPQPSPRR